MSEHHDIHHVTGPKPVAFTVPLILAIVVTFIIVLILSVCDPKTGHAHRDEVHLGRESSHTAPATGVMHERASDAPEAADDGRGHKKN